MVTARAFALVAGSLLAVAVPTARPAVSRSPRAGDRVRIVGGSAAERRLARLVALRVGGVTLRTVRFQTPERALPHMHVRGAEMVVSSSEPKTVRGEWELHLYAGVFTALNARYRVPLGAINAGERVGPVRLWPTFDLYSRVAKSIQVALLRQRLVVMASRLGARVAEFRVASTPARAIALTLQVSDPAAFLKHRAIRFLNILYRTDVPLLGFYVGLKDATGQLVWATSRLANEGAVYAIPQLDACSPVKHSEFGAKPLPSSPRCRSARPFALSLPIGRSSRSRLSLAARTFSGRAHS